LLLGGLAVSAIRSKLKTPGANEVDRGFDLSRKLDANYPREIAVGRFATGGSGVYDTVSGAENQYVWRVTALSDYLITGIEEIWIDGQKVTLSGDPLSGWVNVTDYLTKEDDSPTIKFRIMSGTEDQVLDSELAAAAGEGSYGGELTSDDTFAGMAIAIMRWEFSPDDNITSEPSQIVFVGDGAPVHDPRYEGSDPDDASTWPTDTDARFNPALIAAQAIRGWKRGGEVIVGAHGIVSADIPEADLEDAADICDESVETDDGTEKRYRCGGMIRMDKGSGIRPSLEKVMASMDGDLIEVGGTFTILPGADRTPEHTYDIRAMGGRLISMDEHGAATARYNETGANFVDPDSAWEMQDLPAYAPSADLTADDSRHRVQSLGLDFVYSRFQATRIQIAKHERARLAGTATFELPLIAMQSEPGDWITVTDGQTGLSSSVWEVQTTSRINTRDRGSRVIIQAQEISVDPWAWDQTAADGVDNPTPPTYPIGEIPDPAVPDLTLTAVSVEGGGTTLPAIQAAFSVAESPLETHIEFEYWPTDDDEEIRSTRCLKSAGQRVLVEGVAPGTEYSVRARLIGGTRVGQWCDAETVTTSDGFVSTRAVGSVTQDDIDSALAFLASANPELAAGLATLTQVGAINRVFDPLFQLGIRDNVSNTAPLSLISGDPNALAAELSVGTGEVLDIIFKPRFELRPESRLMVGGEVTLTGPLSQAALQVRFFDADLAEVGTPVEVATAATGERAEGFLEAADIPNGVRWGQLEVVSTSTAAGTARLQVHEPFVAYAGPNQASVEAFRDPQDEAVGRIIAQSLVDQARVFEIEGLVYETAVSRAAVLVLQEVTANVARYQTSVTYEGADGVTYALSELYAADGVSRILNIAGVIAFANPDAGGDGVTVAMEVRDAIVHILKELRLDDDAAFTFYDSGTPDVLRICIGKHPVSGDVGIWLYDSDGVEMFEADVTNEVFNIAPRMMPVGSVVGEGSGTLAATTIWASACASGECVPTGTSDFDNLSVTTSVFNGEPGATVEVQCIANYLATADIFRWQYYKHYLDLLESDGTLISTFYSAIGEHSAAETVNSASANMVSAGRALTKPIIAFGAVTLPSLVSGSYDASGYKARWRWAADDDDVTACSEGVNRDGGNRDATIAARIKAEVLGL
jgi:hypothetical protein